MVEFITVTSGSGGMGKSVFSSNLSCMLKSLGHKVLLIECSFGIRADDVICGLEPATLFTFSDVCTSSCSVFDAITHPEDENLPDFMSFGLKKPQCDFKSEFSKMKNSLSGKYDYAICDLPSYPDDATEAVISASNICIILTDDNFVSVRNAAFIADNIRQISSSSIYTVVNNVIISDDNGLSPEDIIDEISAPLLGIIPADEHIKTTLKGAKLIYKYNTFAGRAYENICKRLTGIPVPEYETGVNNGIFNKNKFILK